MNVERLTEAHVTTKNKGTDLPVHPDRREPIPGRLDHQPGSSDASQSELRPDHLWPHHRFADGHYATVMVSKTVQPLLPIARNSHFREIHG